MSDSSVIDFSKPLLGPPQDFDNHVFATALEDVLRGNMSDEVLEKLVRQIRLTRVEVFDNSEQKSLLKTARKSAKKVANSTSIKLDMSLLGDF